jgi:perosamine synthetase
MTEKLEEKCRELIGRKYCLAVSNTSSAIFMCLYLWSKKYPDKNQVVIPNWGYPAAFKVCKVLRLEPVPVDIRKETLGMTKDGIADRLNEKTLSVIHIENNGIVGDPLEISKMITDDILFIEDCAPSMAQAGAGIFGDVSMFSFSATKPLFAGEGSVILTDSKQMYNDLKLLRHTPDYENMDGTLNFLLSPLLSAYLLPQFDSLKYIGQFRERIHNEYKKYLNIFEELNNKHGAIMYLSKDAEKIHEKLNSYSIEHRYKYYPLYDKSKFPISCEVYNEIIDLPMHHNLTDNEIKFICSVIKKVEK